MTNTVSCIVEHASNGEMILEDISNGTGFVLGEGSILPDKPIFNKPYVFTNEITKTDLTLIIEWTDYIPFYNIPFEDELDDLSKQAAMHDRSLKCGAPILHTFFFI